MPPVEVGNTAPALDLVLADAAGNSHTLGEGLATGPILIGIYKSSCQASKTVFPMLERLHRKYGGDGLTVLGISQDSANVSRSFARRYGVTFPLLIEPDGYPVSTQFDIFATPTVFLIRPDQTVAFTTMGFLKPQINDLAAAVATELNLPSEPITSEDEADVPMFVPG
ncbi:MAG: peroxiredoxin family protein [Thermomicrobiales bacterium]